MEFNGFKKIPRLYRECIVSEKIDGTNAQINIIHADDYNTIYGKLDSNPIAVQNDCYMFAGSRTRWITPENDNYGFARWVKENSEELFLLGQGSHFGEWWGSGIQRGYEMTKKIFSLFNVRIWNNQTKPSCCSVVPVLYNGVFDQSRIQECVDTLTREGSIAAPGYMNPEGIVVYHTAAGHYFKQTCKDDNKSKSQE